MVSPAPRTRLVVSPGNTTQVVVSGVRAPGGSLITNATVGVTLRDSTLAPLSGATWPVVCAYVVDPVDSVSKYIGTIPSGVSIPSPPATIYVDVSVSSGGAQALSRMPAAVENRWTAAYP